MSFKDWLCRHFGIGCPKPPVGPTAKLILAPSSGLAPLTVLADASSSTPGSSPIVSYDFGNGAGLSSTDLITFPNAGTYPVSVVVRDAKGLASSAAAAVSVTAPPPPKPSFAFGFNPTDESDVGPTQVSDAAAQFGVKVNASRVYVGWNDPILTNAGIQDAIAHGYQVVLSVKSGIRGNPVISIRWNSPIATDPKFITNGDYDSDIARQAGEIIQVEDALEKAGGKLVGLVLCHEPEMARDSSQDPAKPHCGEAPDFKAAAAYWAAQLRTWGVTAQDGTVLFAVDTDDATNYDLYSPSNCQITFPDGYDFGANKTPASVWQPVFDFARTRNLKVFIAETNTVQTGQAKADWYAGLADVVNANKDVCVGLTLYRGGTRHFRVEGNAGTPAPPADPIVAAALVALAEAVL